MSTIRLLSGGAAQGLVTQLQEKFLTETGCAVDAIFDAVGTIKDRFMDGEQAMAALAKAKGKGLLSCLQTTEIRFAPGVMVAGQLPPRLELATIYTAAVTTRAANPEGAADFISTLIGPAIASMRTEGGYEA